MTNARKTALPLHHGCHSKTQKDFMQEKDFSLQCFSQIRKVTYTKPRIFAHVLIQSCVLFHRPSQYPKTLWRRWSGTGRPSVQLLRWSPEEGSSTNPSPWRSRSRPFQGRGLPMATRETALPASASSAALQVCTQTLYYFCLLIRKLNKLRTGLIKWIILTAKHSLGSTLISQISEVNKSNVCFVLDMLDANGQI